MEKHTIDCLSIHTREDLHAQLAAALSFPEWYGGNLDALHDCLTDIFTDTELTLQNFSVIKERLGDYAARLLLVLHHATEENPHLTVSLES